MSDDAMNGAGRLFVVADLDRLRPIVQKTFAPHPMTGAQNYLAAIAEIPRAPTRAILVGHDPDCRRPEAALAAIKRVAGAAPVVFCCEPAYEDLGRRLLDHGIDDYVIFPPEADELERSLGIPTRSSRQRWVDTPSAPPVATSEELARLADLLPRLTAGIDATVLDDMAGLVACALDAEFATIVLHDQMGQSGRPAEGAAPTLVEPIVRSAQAIGQIRVGPNRRGGYQHEDTARLRTYGQLFGKMLESADRADEWRKLAMTDDLTGLPNRRSLLTFLEEKLAAAEKARKEVTLLIFDIDDFKKYNDAYGHDAGDQILCDIGGLFRQCSRETDLVARYGGDEFVVVFWDAEAPRTVGSHHPKVVVEVVQRFRNVLKNHKFTRLGPEAQGRLTISGGLAQYPWQARTGPELIEVADQALLQAKAAGKDGFWLVGSGDVPSET